MTLSSQRFNRIIASLSGDRDLFAEIAVSAARHYTAAAGQVRLLIDEKNYARLLQFTHKLKAAWALYAGDDADVLQHLEEAIRKMDDEKILEYTEILIKALHSVSYDLVSWAEHYRKNKN